MKLGVVSDTHGHVENTLLAAERLKRLQVDTILHCGDIGLDGVVEAFEGWPTYFVFGNTDHERAELKLAIRNAGHFCMDEYGELEISGRHIAFLHGDDTRRWIRTIQSQAYDLVCYGHTHKAEIRQEGRTLVLNPGALYRANPHTIAVVDLTTMDVEHIPIEDA